MSDIIHLLSDAVANQIAAGEVIQRPASVVKELVENAVDAQATLIQVQVKDAGRTLIQVIDNGKGMSTTDARMAFERHATSKISKSADLFTLKTMGFRGEALASIAAIAQVELRTRRAEDDLGTDLHISASQVEQSEPISCPVGSNFMVKNIFYNVPARRKFLKTNQTELSNIIQEFERIALVNTDTAFVLKQNDAEVFNLPASGLRQRIVNIFGKSLNQNLLPVDVTTSVVSISGFIGKPESARKKNPLQFFFVNGRYMRHPYFHRAVTQCYEPLLAPGEMPNYFLYLTVDPAAIDVNIHPTKTEIKFEDETVIFQILSAAVKEAFGKYSAVPSIDFDMDGAVDIPVFDQSKVIDPPKVSFNADYNPFQTPRVSSYSPGGGSSYGQTYASKANPAGWDNLYPDKTEVEGGEAQPSDQNSGFFQPATHFLDQSEDTEPFFMPEPVEVMQEEHQKQATFAFDHETDSPANLTGSLVQLNGKYIVANVSSGMMLIDQHRAHILISYEENLERITSQQTTSQRVLFPEIIEFTPAESAFIPEIIEELFHLGFDMSDLGGNSFSINGIPGDIKRSKVRETLIDLVHTAQEKVGAPQEEIQKMLALSFARSTAIPYGKSLTQEEMQSLVDRLFGCQVHNYTPDGKKIIVVFDANEIDKKFN
ncbi:MAG: DNA mismatch repair endonuclease MutL [Bacteroidales bacterium]